LRTSQSRCKVGQDSSPAAGVHAGLLLQERAGLETRRRRGRPPHLVATVLLCGALLLTGCRRDMQDQPKYIALRPSSFFDDGRSERPLVEGTVARGHLNADTAFYTGKIDNKPVDTFPFPVTRAVLERGQQRYNIYCSPCHDLLGTGKGMIFRRGFDRPPPQSYHIDRLRQAPVGYFFDVISNGLGAMPDYAAQIEPRDRWAIVAYVRVLQLSQNASLNDVPAEERAALAKGVSK
jgi:mono/diheme cytochrome c family protein